MRMPCFHANLAKAEALTVFFKYESSHQKSHFVSTKHINF